MNTDICEVCLSHCSGIPTTCPCPPCIVCGEVGKLSCYLPIHLTFHGMRMTEVQCKVKERNQKMMDDLQKEEDDYNDKWQSLP